MYLILFEYQDGKKLVIRAYYMNGVELSREVVASYENYGLKAPSREQTRYN